MATKVSPPKKIPKRTKLELMAPEVEMVTLHYAVAYDDGSIYSIISPIKTVVHAFAVYYSDDDRVPRGLKRQVPYLVKDSMRVDKKDCAAWLAYWRKLGSPVDDERVVPLKKMGELA
jgi:hypothetical protein